MAIEKIIALLLLYNQCGYARQLNAAQENQLENLTLVIPDDAIFQHPRISLNTADSTMLQSLELLTPLQIKNFLLYRQLLGRLLSIYELQAIPGFDMALIRRILPYVAVGEDLQPHYSLRDYTHKGDHSILMRYGREIEPGSGYTDAHYLGSPDKLLVRYRYNFPRYMSWGIVMEKDAGEQFFRGAQKNGFDFYSVHIFVKNYKHIKALAFGDFTVNMGQGLINWQSLALGKGPAVMQIKREADLLRPYTSAGEFYFYRGAGITLRQGIWESTGFISLRKEDSDFGSTGYHRSLTEIQKRNTEQQFTTGANLSLIKPQWHTGINIIKHQFSIPVKKEAAPYNLFTFSDKQLLNASIDYAVTCKNLHFFGEVAISDNYKIGMVHGVLASVAKNADFSLLYRHYDRAYQSMYANAFGEYYKPANEQGLYTAVSMKVIPSLTLNAYADVFAFPWLKYSTNGPTNGEDLLFSLTYTPDKHTEVFISQRQKNWRCQTTMQLAEGLTLKTRVALNSYEKERGFLLFSDVVYQLPGKSLQLSGRYTKFMTGGTDTRMYVAATGMLYEYVLSQLYGKGYQYQLRARWKIKPHVTLWARFQREIHPGVSSANKNSAIQLQIEHLFQR
jgi:hypothetical protein